MNANSRVPAFRSRFARWSTAALIPVWALVAACTTPDSTPHAGTVLLRSEDALRQTGYTWISPQGDADADKWYAAQKQCRKEIVAASTDQVQESAVPQPQVNECMRGKGWKFERPKK